MTADSELSSIGRHVNTVSRKSLGIQAYPEAYSSKNEETFRKENL